MKKLSLLSVIVILLIAQCISVLGAKEVTLGLSSRDFQPHTGEAVILNNDSPKDPDHLPPCSVRANELDGDLTLTWLEPGTPGGDWFSYCGAPYTAIGTQEPASFDAAIRYPADSLAAYAGMSLQAVKIYPSGEGSFAIRVWTGGWDTYPGFREVHQPFTHTLNTFNTVILNEPVYITGEEGLWFGYNVVISEESYPLACDEGPAVAGFGDMLFIQDNWVPLSQLGYSYNWCIEGYIGYYPPTTAPTISFPMIANGDMDRTVTGYQAFRFYLGQEADETNWIAVNDALVTSTTIQDPEWDNLIDASYRWAIKATFDDGIVSGPGFSNSILKVNAIGTIAGYVRNQANQPVAGATVIAGNVSATTNYNGSFFIQVPAGTHTVKVIHVEYENFTQENVVVVMEQTTPLNIILTHVPNIIADGFESYADFAIEFEPWTLVDVDQGNTYGIEDVTWENALAPQAFIIFNPGSTTPPLSDILQARSGDKMAACFASTNLANNDWLITRGFKGAEGLNFWARSLTDAHGLERFKIGVSTTGTDPADFTIISGDNYVEAPEAWTEYSYDLAAYTQQHIHIGIQCVSNDAMAFLVDNVRVSGNEVSTDDPGIPATQTRLETNYPNPFNPETTISYNLSRNQNAKLEIYNTKGQLVRTLVNEAQNAGKHSVIWSGTDNQNRPVASGVYYYKLTAGNYTSTKKMVLMK